MTLPPGLRKALLLVHVVTSVGFIGAAAAFLALAVAGVMGAPVYPAMQIVTWTVVVPLAFASLLIGILSSLTTPWGLLRSYWVIFKLVLTVLAVGVLLLQTRTINGLADGAVEGREAMILHAAGGIAVLVVVSLLSVYKPRGTTGYGARKLAGR